MTSPQRGRDNMHTPRTLIPQTLETLASLPVVKIEPPPSPTKPDKMVANPLRTEWQRKWLALDVTHPMIQGLADAVADFAKAFFWRKPTKNLVLIGNPGC